MSFDSAHLRCRECKFWWPLAHAGTPASREKSTRGQCRRHAPPAFLVGANESDIATVRKPAWAITGTDDWCGEFAHREYKT